ncbi:MAG: PQQ-dependent sugar dehydrogenase, partial [Pseudomonadota bacterium]|nr:PQQ-dependent sugar dehydrogenase [Pseudomonadota bacterium]
MLRSVLLTLCLPTAALAADPVAQGPKNVPEFEPAFANQTRAPAMTSGFGVDAQWFARGLERPWGMAALPDGRFLVTERVGRLRMLSPDGTDLGEVTGLPEVFVKGQGGMLDVMVGPDFADDGLVYGTYAKPMGGGTSVTAAFVATLDVEARQMNDVQDVFVQNRPSPTAAHYGSRIL